MVVPVPVLVLQLPANASQEIAARSVIAVVLDDQGSRRCSCPRTLCSVRVLRAVLLDDQHALSGIVEPRPRRRVGTRA